jgi:multisubunit Na+/H+ antiporter MnhF subunit
VLTTSGGLAGSDGAPDFGTRWRVSAEQAKASARRVPRIADELRRTPNAEVSALRKDGRWVVQAFTRGKDRKQIVEVYVDPYSGRVREAWTGPQVAWGMARGYPGAFGRSVNSPWLWVTLCVLFVAPFLDVRRPLRMLHLDLLMLVGFSVSLAFFNDANLDASVPLSAVPLAYLAVRLAWIGLRRSPGPAPPLRLLVPWQALAIVGLFLVGLRVGLNIVDGNVIDVGYSGVIGADKLAHGRELYGAFPNDNRQGDTYGPLLYLAYVPFELIWPWKGRWDALPAAHAASAVFDLACVVLLFLIGRRLRDTALGVVLAYAWLAFPFTIYATNSGTNDALPAALVLAAIWAAGRPFARGALGMAAGLTKFASLALMPVLASHGLRHGRAARPLGLFLAGAGLVLALGALLMFWRTDPATVWDRTIGYQAGREAPFSVWGLYGGGWEVAQSAVQLAVVLFAVGVAFAPRRDDVVGLAAICGAILAGTQLATTYWFYLYLVWALPLALIAYVGRLAVPVPERVVAPASVSRSPDPRTAPAAARSPLPAAAPPSG